MQKGERFRLVAVIGLVIALMSAGFAIAGDTFDEPQDEPTTCVPVDDPVDESDTTEDGDTVEEGEEPADGDTVEDGEEPTDGEEPEEGEEPVDDSDDPVEEDEGDTEDCDDPVEEDETTEDDETVEDGEAEEGDDAAQAEDYAAEDCLTAAGLEAGDEPLEAPVPGELHGLKNAMAHLLWNCLDHPNHGLVNALTKHAEKLDAWLEKQELKAERKAERDAAKAERRAQHDAAKAARELARAS